MSNHPNFSSYGYQISRELGRNREGGRITYLATVMGSSQSSISARKRSGESVNREALDATIKPDQQVVIKEFRFAISDANWSGFKAYQREIEVLQQLDHPRIPRYLDSFETSEGFCLVQEYKNAPTLAERRIYYPEQIKQIAVSVLEILVDLQKRVPPVIHRDIKPENILVDKQQNAYLIDFGFARVQNGNLALSSVAAGTIGFMPPEENFGRPLTEASDLYSLGVTLICLLTGTRSVDIGKLIDDNYCFNFQKLVPKCSPQFVAWLTKMVEANPKKRYPNASAALAALKPIQVIPTHQQLVKPLAVVAFLVMGGAIAIASKFLPSQQTAYQPTPINSSPPIIYIPKNQIPKPQPPSNYAPPIEVHLPSSAYDLRSKISPNAELHAIGVYHGFCSQEDNTCDKHKPGKVEVKITKNNRPIVLVLSSYEPEKWYITKNPDVQIEYIILGGYYKQEIVGIESSIPIVNKSYENGGSSYLYLGHGDDYSEGEAYYKMKYGYYKTLYGKDWKKPTSCSEIPLHEEEEEASYLKSACKLKEMTGLDLTSFQGKYGGKTFEINNETRGHY